MRGFILIVGLMLPFGLSASEGKELVDQLDGLVGPFIEEVQEPQYVPFELQPSSKCVPSKKPIVGRYSEKVDLGGGDRLNQPGTSTRPQPGGETGSDREPLSTPVDLIGGLVEVEVILDKIINIGGKLWKIVEANKPVVNVQFEPAHAVPSGIQCWMDVEYWKRPESRTFRVSFRNYLGMEPVVFKYRVTYSHGGSIDGVGQYLANVLVTPVEVSVRTGYQLDATASVPGVLNMGDASDPLAGMQLILNLKISTVLQEKQVSANFFISGDGGFSHEDAGKVID